jgi:hypothetical protein
MRSDAPKRIEKWRVKTQPERVCATLKDMRNSMERNTEAAQVLLVEIETRAKQVLNSANVPTILYPYYLNFAREIFSRMIRFSGSSLVREVNVLLEKWVARTLDQQVLERIRDEAFAVPEPEE